MSGAVTIVGRGALCGAGRGVDAFWRAMRGAQPGHRAHPLGDGRLGDGRYVAVPEPRDPDGDLAARWAALAIEDALLDAQPVLQHLVQPRSVLLGGSSLGGMTLYERQQRAWWDPEGETGPGLSTDPGTPTWRAAYDGPAAYLGQQSPAGAGGWTLNTACSSAANALGLARTWLAKRRVDVAVVVGFDVISPFVYAGFSGLHAVDPEATTPFGAERRGLNLGEAAVALVLCRPEDARGGEGAIDLVGYGTSCDAHHLTRPDLTGGGLARAVHIALRDAGAGAGDIGFISAHGTGTPFNDTMEAAAFVQVFGERRPPLHCAKPITGHTLGAAGAVDALLVCEALRHGIVPATYRRGDEDTELAFHPTTTEQPLAPSTLALSTSSGFGGSNAALLFRRAEAP